MGHWIKKIDAPHVHDYPQDNVKKYLGFIGVGSIWECECGKRFKYNAYVSTDISRVSKRWVLINEN